MMCLGPPRDTAIRWRRAVRERPDIAAAWAPAVDRYRLVVLGVDGDLEPQFERLSLLVGLDVDLSVKASSLVIGEVLETCCDPQRLGRVP